MSEARAPFVPAGGAPNVPLPDGYIYFWILFYKKHKKTWANGLKLAKKNTYQMQKFAFFIASYWWQIELTDRLTAKLSA